MYNNNNNIRAGFLGEYDYALNDTVKFSMDNFMNCAFGYACDVRLCRQVFDMHDDFNLPDIFMFRLPQK